MHFVGYAPLGENFVFPLLTKDSVNEPLEPSSLPPFRVYSAAGLMANGTGSGAKLNTGTVTGATNAAPIVITSTAHGLKTGTQVTITGAVGNTAANGTFVITRISDDTFSLDGSTGNGTWTSGGTWHVSGLHTVTVPVTEGNGYEPGTSYFVLVEWVISSQTYGDVFIFTVV